MYSARGEQSSFNLLTCLAAGLQVAAPSFAPVGLGNTGSPMVRTNAQAGPVVARGPYMSRNDWLNGGYGRIARVIASQQQWNAHNGLARGRGAPRSIESIILGGAEIVDRSISKRLEYLRDLRFESSALRKYAMGLTNTPSLSSTVERYLREIGIGFIDLAHLEEKQMKGVRRKVYRRMGSSIRYQKRREELL